MRSLSERGWSVRPVGARGALLRSYAVPREPLQFPAPAGVTGAVLRPAIEGAAAADGEVKVAAGTAEARVNLGEHVIEWTTA